MHIALKLNEMINNVMHANEGFKYATIITFIRFLKNYPSMRWGTFLEGCIE